MTTYRKIVLGLTSGLLVACLGACSSTRVDALWQSPGLTRAKPEGPILVVGLARDEALRRIYEDAMTAALAQKSVRAIPAYTVVPGPLDDASEARILEAAHDAGATRVLSSSIVDRQLVQHLVTAPPAYRPYAYAWPYVNGPFVRLDDRFIARTTLSDVASGKVIWAARSSTRDLGSVKHEIRDFAAAIVHELDVDGLV